MIRANLPFASPRFARLDYYITSLSVCQEVFQKFFKNFFNRFPAGAEVPEYYITSSRVCQEVFQKFFQLFFVIFFEAVSRGRPLVDSLHIIALRSLFVNSFLESFFGLETIAVCHKNVVAKLYILHKTGCIRSRKAPLPGGRGTLHDYESYACCHSQKAFHSRFHKFHRFNHDVAHIHARNHFGQICLICLIHFSLIE